MEKYRSTFNAFVPLNQLQICTIIKLYYQILYVLKFELILKCKPSSESTSFFLVHFSYQVCLPCWISYCKNIYFDTFLLQLEFAASGKFNMCSVKKINRTDISRTR